MKTQSFKLIPFCMLWGTLLSLVWVLNWGCGSSALTGGGSTGGGGSGGSGGSGSGISIRGAVEVPASVSTSSNKSLAEENGSVSKSASISGSEGFEEGVVAKATTKPSSGDVTAKNFAGTVLDTGTISPVGEITGVEVDPAKLGSDKQVILEVKAGGSSTILYIQHDLNGKTAGETVTETVTTKTALAALQVLASCGSDTSFSNMSACGSAVSAGTLQPDAVYKVYKSMSGTAGTGSLGAMNEAMRKIFEGSIAAGKPPSPSDMLAMLQGSASKIAEYTSAASLSYDATALAGIKEFPSACKSYFNATVKAKFDSGGDAAYRDAGADFFANLDPAKGDLTNIIDQPDLYRNLVGEFLDDFNAGNTSALGAFEKSDFARMMAELGDEVTASGMTSAQYDALKTQMMGGSWGNQDPAKMAAAFGNLVSASDDSTEVAYWSKLDIFGNPDLFGGASGKNMFDQQFIQLAQGGGTASFTPCTTGANCAVGKVCSTTCYKCVDETNSGSALARCEKCTASSQCGTSYCDAAGFCNYPLGFTGNLLGKVFKLNGASCTSGSECWSGQCSGGTCGGSNPEPPPPDPVITGVFDTTFDADGFFTQGGNGGDNGYAIGTDGAGNVYISGGSNGDMAIWKLTPAGVLDTGFAGGDGIFTHHNAAGGNGADLSWAVTLDGAGSIYIAGYSVNATPNSDMAVWKLTPAGILDTGFAGGDGIFTHNGGGGTNGEEEGQAIALDNAGNIYVCGYGRGTGDDMVVWRLTPAGVLDTSFGGGDGIFVYSTAGSSNDYAYGMVLDSAGSIYVTGLARGNGDDMAVLKLTPAGALDTTFAGGDGIFTHHNAAGGNSDDSSRAITLDNAGNIYVAGQSTNGTVNADTDMVAWKLTPAGVLDTSFGGGDGVFVHNGAAGGNFEDYGQAITLDSSGKIYVGGTSYRILDDWNATSMAVWRLTPAGVLDTDFGGGDGIFTHFGAAGSIADSGRAIKYNAGNVYVGGFSSRGANNDMAIWNLK